MKKIKKFTAMLMTSALLLLPAKSTLAEVVTVDGYGISETAAINDAKRNAVEQVVGTIIKSHSVAQNLELVMDAIDTRTQGYVNSFKIISKGQEGNNIKIQAQVDVSSEPSSSLMKDVELVMSLNDPRLGVVMEYYGDDGGETYKKYPTMTKAAIREELIKRGFSHIVDANGDVDYVIIGNMTVNKSKSVKLPNWNNISDSEFKTVDTGMAKTIATMDCKIKKYDTDELIGEFHVSGDEINASDNDIQSQAVLKMAANAAQEVRKLFNREASRVFSSVKVIIKINDGEKALQFEELLRQTQGVNSVYLRSFKGEQCTIDVGTDLAPQELYRVLSKDSLKMRMTGFSSTTLEITID